MGKDVSNLSIENLNSIFLGKIKDYISMMKYYLTYDELQSRKNEVLDELDSIIKEYKISKKDYEESKSLVQESDDSIKVESVIKEKQDKFETVSNRISSLINNEVEFLHFMTTDFSSEYKDHGVQYTESHVKNYTKTFYTGIDTAATYSVINTLALKKRCEGENFDYPEEMEDEEVKLYQIKDEIVLDMMNLLGDNFMRFYFLGKGREFDRSLMSLFMLDAALSEKEVKNKMDSLNIGQDEAEVRLAIENRNSFDSGINRSVKENKEDFYDKYIYIVNKIKRVPKVEKIETEEEIKEKAPKGLK